MLKGSCGSEDGGDELYMPSWLRDPERPAIAEWEEWLDDVAVNVEDAEDDEKMTLVKRSRWSRAGFSHRAPA